MAVSMISGHRGKTISAHQLKNRRDGLNLGCSLNETRNVWDPGARQSIIHPFPRGPCRPHALPPPRVAGLDSEPRGPQHPYGGVAGDRERGRGEEDDEAHSQPPQLPPPAPPPGCRAAAEPNSGQSEAAGRDVTAPGGGLRCGG